MKVQDQRVKPVLVSSTSTPVAERIERSVRENSGRPGGTSRFSKGPSDNKGRGTKYSWLVYPDYWKSSWGQIPCLGMVRADDEFHAKYAAYDKGLLPYNFTFGPKVVKYIGKGKENDSGRTGSSKENSQAKA